jgi:hypothetical protein
MARLCRRMAKRLLSRTTKRSLKRYEEPAAMSVE